MLAKFCKLTNLVFSLALPLQRSNDVNVTSELSKTQSVSLHEVRILGGKQTNRSLISTSLKWLHDNYLRRYSSGSCYICSALNLISSYDCPKIIIYHAN